MRLMRTILILLSLAFLAACTNTFQGVGRDVETMGQKMQNVGNPDK